MRKRWIVFVLMCLSSGCTIKVCGDSETQLQTGDGHMLETLTTEQKGELDADVKVPAVK